jgi:hypothetical protein
MHNGMGIPKLVTAIIGNMVLMNPGFPHKKEFL